MNTSLTSHRALAVGAALAFALVGGAVLPHQAQGITYETEARINETQRRVEESARIYEQAVAKLAELQNRIDANTAEIEQLKAQLPAQREKAGRAMKSTYKAKQGTNAVMSMVFGSESLDELLSRITYLDQIQSSNTQALDVLGKTKRELERQETELAQAKRQAQEEKETADAALAEAKRLRAEAQKTADAEAANELEALTRAAQEQAEGQGTQPVYAAATVSPVDWSLDLDAFIEAWAPRIDAYLAGSPLEGYGASFARAAWTYGVDPRFSPAIANTESSKGQHLFREHNAWGWGQIDFSNWEEAIDTHVRGLAQGYGYTISVSGAKKYCPPNWFNWYNNTSAEMARI
ncbi:hypothetical protein K6V98_00645 [Collinsella sp. AGMB00827]|uniref:Uncharacterized protein n=1 Tax=Collinsella ureilytica TaxID=2869515 RepID=A0ABS7MHP7_9ACTN|nr:hypothetical protein [Collinsella urealyticum]MBY4796875.1 hypothetical protein [Collinsella urealyticum]